MLGSRKVYALKDHAPKKWDYYWWLIHLSIKKRGGALLLLVVDFSQFSKSYIRFTKKTHSKEMTPQLQLPHYLHFGSFGPSNTTTRQCRLWWRKPKKGVISTIRIGSMGLVYLLYIHHVPWGWCIDVLWVHFSAKLVGI